MKKIKNNKGVTGIDIVVSITIILIVLGIVIVAYSTYSNKVKEVKRTTTATNLAMQVIEYVEELDINNNDIISIPIKDGEGVDEKPITSGYGIVSFPKGYNVFISKKNSESGNILNNIAFQVDVKVTFTVKNEPKEVTLSMIKKSNELGEIEKPKLDKISSDKYKIMTIEDGVEKYSEVYPIKYDSEKGGYVKTKKSDLEWYSISSKVFPLVIEANDKVSFDRNGVLKLTEKKADGTYKYNGMVYIWEPLYYIETGRKDDEGKSLPNIVYFCTEEVTEDGAKVYKKIVYKNENKLSSYTTDDTGEITTSNSAGWRVISSDNLINPNKQLNHIYNSIFKWDSE